MRLAGEAEEIDHDPVREHRDRAHRSRVGDRLDVVRLIQAEGRVGQHPGDLLGAAALLGDLPAAPLAGDDPALGLDPAGHVMERVDHDASTVGQGRRPGQEHGPVLRPVSEEPEPDDERIDRLALEQPPAGQAVKVERLTLLIDHLEPFEQDGSRGEHVTRGREAGHPGGVGIDVHQSTAIVLHCDPGADAREDGVEVGWHVEGTSLALRSGRSQDACRRSPTRPSSA